MKIVCFALFGVAIVFCILGLSGHKEAWPAAALCFFAAIMVIVGIVEIGTIESVRSIHL